MKCSCKHSQTFHYQMEGRCAYLDCECAKFVLPKVFSDFEGEIRVDYHEFDEKTYGRVMIVPDDKPGISFMFDLLLTPVFIIGEDGSISATLTE